MIVLTDGVIRCSVAASVGRCLNQGSDLRATLRPGGSARRRGRGLPLVGANSAPTTDGHPSVGLWSVVLIEASTDANRLEGDRIGGNDGVVILRGRHERSGISQDLQMEVTTSTDLPRIQGLASARSLTIHLSEIAIFETGRSRRTPERCSRQARRDSCNKKS
jgi:hypothetical protein